VLAPDTITLHALSKGRNTTQTDLTDHGWQGFTANLGDVDGRLFSVEMGTGLILVLSASAAMIVCGVVVLICDRNMKPVEQDKGVLSPQRGYSAPDDSGEQSLDFSDLNFDDSSREE